MTIMAHSNLFDSVPDMQSQEGHRLYLMVDGGQIEDLAQQLYSLEGELDITPVYTQPPYDQLLAVSPFIVRMTDAVWTWFTTLNQPTAGYVFASSHSGLDVAHQLRDFIQVLSPYGSKVFLKLAHSECIDALLVNDFGGFWSLMLRLVILEAIVNPEAIVAHNPDYPAQVSAWQRKVNAEVAMITRISQPPVGQPTPKNHQIQTMHAAQQRLQKLLSSELPQMVMLKHQAANDAAKKMLNQTIERIWQKGAQAAQTSWNKLGGTGGILAILNIWNSASVLHNIRYKAEQYPETSLWANPALREATYSTAYAVSEVVGLWQGAAWKKIITDEELLKKSLSRALDTSVASEKAILRSFANTTAIVSLFGFIATGLEAWDSYKKYDDLSNTSMESLGYVLKGVAAGSQAVVFVAQAVANFASRFGILGTSIGSIISTWMMTTLMVAGIVSLLAVLIINLVKRSDLEMWLLHSTWGKQTKQ
ncbi:DUF4123 domain-containing protein [Salinivibrio kushneri]|uniref:DUF4123 domain-containing protein n=1 Tax=Salinivibrio kushneri TaxID=1908198 RepID=UPI00098887B1|nr:DUF4123 domain-containing protein [Salinivibrio kushneri]OOE54256.1 hypothetical protein BZG12_07060 [Salinivibrio kushneri]